MRTFLEFVEEKNAESNIVWHLQRIEEEAQNNPQLAEILMQEGWWDNIKNWWNTSRFGQAANQFVGGATSGIKAGAQAAASAFTGPLAQFQNALRSLQNASRQVNTDPTLQQSTTTGSASFPAMNLGKWLNDTAQELQSQIGQLQNKQLTKATAGYGAPAQPAATTGPSGSFTPPVATAGKFPTP